MRQRASFAPRAESNNLPGMSEAVNSLIANMQRQQELKHFIGKSQKLRRKRLKH